MRFTKYMDDFVINNHYFIMNLINGALIEVTLDNYLLIKAVINNKESIDKISKEDIELLKEQCFVVDETFDEQQVLKNHLTYSVSKYSCIKNTLKIDFALTDKCNFNCPYCFEKDNLCKNQNENKNILINTSEKLINYIDVLTDRYKYNNVDLILYGGEPTIEKDISIKIINKIKNILIHKNVVFQYSFVTNGFLFDEKFINELSNNDCKFIQITIDGEKGFHNSRRTNLKKINTFDTIIKNINMLMKNNFHVVIRLNVDKTNYKSIVSFVENLETIIDSKYYGSYLDVDVARVFDSKDSFDLLEYEEYREKIIDICLKKRLIRTNITAQPLTTFCVAESLGNDLVIDFKGDIYRCWNNVFDTNYSIGNIDDRINNDYEVLDVSSTTLNFVEKYSLDNVNNNECFNCIYCKYCQGLCPAVRNKIIKNCERNIYINDECKKIIHNRLLQLIANIKEQQC